MLVNDKYKIRLNTTFQPSIKILNKCSCVSEDTKWVPSLLRFVAISSSYSLKLVFLRKSRDALLCFSEPRFGFPTLVRTHATTFVTFILVFENIQNSFSCGPPFGPCWSVKYVILGQKLPLWKAHHTFLDSRHPEVTIIILFLRQTKITLYIYLLIKPQKGIKYKIL